MENGSTEKSTESGIKDPITVTFENEVESIYEAADFLAAIKGATTRRLEGFDYNIRNIAYTNDNYREAISAFLELPYASLRQPMTACYNNNGNNIATRSSSSDSLIEPGRNSYCNGSRK